MPPASTTPASQRQSSIVDTSLPSFWDPTVEAAAAELVAPSSGSATLKLLLLLLTAFLLGNVLSSVEGSRGGEGGGGGGSASGAAAPAPLQQAQPEVRLRGGADGTGPRPCAASKPHGHPLGKLTFPPDIDRLVINVGSNRNPPMPVMPGMAVIAVEPVLQTALQIPVHPRLYVITAAISSTEGFTQFNIYNQFSESGSLAQIANITPGAWWANVPEGYPPSAFVPVLTLGRLLEAVPDHLRIVMLKTDMQSFDFTAVSAAPRRLLQRVETIYSEVYCFGYEFYKGSPSNDMVDWLPFMTDLGFVNVDAEGTCRMHTHPHESNAYWFNTAFEGHEQVNENAGFPALKMPLDSYKPWWQPGQGGRLLEGAGGRLAEQQQPEEQPAPL
jgi:hypothetical protein